jgi:hypothetical protein
MSHNENNCLPLSMWEGMTAMCRHCGQLITVVVWDEEEFVWQHTNGYFGCGLPDRMMYEPGNPLSVQAEPLL